MFRRPRKEVLSGVVRDSGEEKQVEELAGSGAPRDELDAALRQAHRENTNDPQGTVEALEKTGRVGGTS